MEKQGQRFNPITGQVMTQTVKPQPSVKHLTNKRPTGFGTANEELIFGKYVSQYTSKSKSNFELIQC